MLILILLLVVGSVLVYISKFNFMPVSVNLGLYTFPNIPLYEKQKNGTDVELRDPNAL
ncbi:MAG: hypothetical protein NTV24_05150 [Candidatus Woesebacteria bacterium]|nr:hypothetical protein [Candidatus Woesebacteria bacterium]